MKTKVFEIVADQKERKKLNETKIN